MPNTTWVYVRSEPNLFTVGFFSPDGKWHPDSDWPDQKQAGARVHWLNGGARDDYEEQEEGPNDY